MTEPVRLFADAWKLMASRLPSPRIEEADGVATCFGNVPLIFFNVSMLVRPAATADELRALLSQTARRASACQHPSGVLVREDWLPAGSEEIVKECGLAPMVPMTAMEANELLPARRPPAALEILRVANDAMARDLAELNAQAYHIPVDSFECIANMRFWPSDHYAYVGYLNGKPVSCAAALPVDGTVYVALVATLPEAQGKGYAETVMRRAVIEGQQAMGTTRTTLHASDMGLPVYRAMGYTEGSKLIFLGPAS